jgi:valyl-tRNA synthetase
MEEFRFYMASEKIYQYTWHSLADVILEDSKKIFSDNNDKAKISRKQFLIGTLSLIIKVLHPFMPFLTEELWSMLPIDNKKLLIIEEWPIK